MSSVAFRILSLRDTEEILILKMNNFNYVKFLFVILAMMICENKSTVREFL